MPGVTPADYRRALRRWPSGVTVVTMGEGPEAHGLTVSSFASVSLDPPTVLVCIHAASRAHLLLRTRPCFAVNILSAGQRAISEYFARTARGSRLDTAAGPVDGLTQRAVLDPAVLYRAGRVVACPILDGAAAVLECVVVQSVEVGDHVTYFGRVDATEETDLDPLLYFDGGYQDVVFGRRKQSRAP